MVFNDRRQTHQVVQDKLATDLVVFVMTSSYKVDFHAELQIIIVCGEL